MHVNLNDASPDSSVRSWRPLSRNDNPLLMSISIPSGMADIVTLEFIPGVVNTQEFPIHKNTQYRKLRNRLSPLGKGGIGVSSSYLAEESDIQLN